MDIGDIVVEHGEIEEEEGRIARFLLGGCSCKLHDGTPCCTQFTASMLQEARAECRQLSREQFDMVVRVSYRGGGRTGISPPSLSFTPPEILKFSMVFGQDCVRSNLRRSKNQKFSFGDMPPDPPRLLAR